MQLSRLKSCECTSHAPLPRTLSESTERPVRCRQRSRMAWAEEGASLGCRGTTCAAVTSVSISCSSCHASSICITRHRTISNISGAVANLTILLVPPFCSQWCDPVMRTSAVLEEGADTVGRVSYRLICQNPTQETWAVRILPWE